MLDHNNYKNQKEVILEKVTYKKKKIKGLLGQAKQSKLFTDNVYVTMGHDFKIMFLL